MSDKQEIKALVIRIRLYTSQEKYYVTNTTQRYLYACEVLGISIGTARNILTKCKRIKRMSLEEAKKELKKRNEYMYNLAITDVNKSLYEGK
ncbi:MAG: hypothetical protein Q4Q06_04955 [Bacteroidota bacterium]|nr:hypothetical protein [Bacteroidota bacterium]